MEIRCSQDPLKWLNHVVKIQCVPTFYCKEKITAPLISSAKIIQEELSTQRSPNRARQPQSPGGSNLQVTSSCTRSFHVRSRSNPRLGTTARWTKNTNYIHIASGDDITITLNKITFVEESAAHHRALQKAGDVGPIAQTQECSCLGAFTPATWSSHCMDRHCQTL